VNRAFADTCYYLALLNSEDELHAKAKEITESHATSHLTTTWVLTEVADALCRPLEKKMVADFIQELIHDRHVTVLPPTRRLFDAGLDLFRGRADKNWSLTDCISFFPMDENGISQALTADHHFEQAGFTILMRD